MGPNWSITVGPVQSSVSRHTQMLHKHVLPRWKDVPITSVTKADVREWVGNLITNGYKPDVIRCSAEVLRSSCKAALEAGVISTNPVIGISLPRKPTREMHPLTVEQIEALAEAVSYPELRAAEIGARTHGRTERPDLGLAVRLAAYTGLRAGELWALRPNTLILIVA